MRYYNWAVIISSFFTLLLYVAPIVYPKITEIIPYHVVIISVIISVICVFIRINKKECSISKVKI